MIEASKRQGEKVDLGIDAPITKKAKYQKKSWVQNRSLIESLPPVFDIQAPAVGLVESCTISVRVAKDKGLPLYVELSQHTIDYLRRVVQVQIDEGGTHRKRSDRPDESKVDAPAGFSFSYSRNRLVKKNIVFSPISRKRKSHISYHKFVTSSASTANIDNDDVDALGGDGKCLDSSDVLGGDEKCEDSSDVPGGDDKCEDSSELEEVRL